MPPFPDSSKEYKLSNDENLANYLDQMVQKIAAGADQTPYVYRVYLVESEVPNAFTPGAGHIFVTTGLVSCMGTEAQMAMVLAHEMAHVTESHVVRGMRDRKIMVTGGTIGSSALDSKLGTSSSSPVVKTLIKYTLSVMVNGHSREFESEADRIGLTYMARAGYDPREAPKTFETLKRVNGEVSRIQNFFHGSHPLAGERAEVIRGMLVDFPAQQDAIRTTRNYTDLTKRYRQSCPVELAY